APPFPQPPAAGLDTPGPATMPDLGAATIPGFPRLDTGQDAADLDVTRPIPVADQPSQQSLGFAAAPVPHPLVPAPRAVPAPSGTWQPRTSSRWPRPNRRRTQTTTLPAPAGADT